MIIRKAKKEELGEILDLTWDTFLRYEALDYPEEGINEFRSFINNKDAINRLDFYCAYENDVLLGIIATRNQNNHIALFFVKGEYQGKGIGRKLYECVKEINESGEITVNSTPYAVEIYKRLGFTPVKEEQITNGMRYTPMKTLIRK